MALQAARKDDKVGAHGSSGAATGLGSAVGSGVSAAVAGKEPSNAILAGMGAVVAAVGKTAALGAITGSMSGGGAGGGSACGSIMSGSPDVNIQGSQAARAQRDTTSHNGANIMSGALYVSVNDAPLAVRTSAVKCGGQVITGASNVLVGGPLTTTASATKGGALGLLAGHALAQAGSALASKPKPPTDPLLTTAADVAGADKGLRGLFSINSAMQAASNLQLVAPSLLSAAISGANPAQLLMNVAQSGVIGVLQQGGTALLGAPSLASNVYSTMLGMYAHPDAGGIFGSLKGAVTQTLTQTAMESLHGVVPAVVQGGAMGMVQQLTASAGSGSIKDAFFNGVKSAALSQAMSVVGL